MEALQQTPWGLALAPAEISGYVGDVIESYDLSVCRRKPNMTVLDVGGNIGLFTMMVARKLSPSRIVVFEPQPEMFRYLSANLSGRDECELFNEAVLDRDGMCRLFNPFSFMTTWRAGGDDGDTPCRDIVSIVREMGVVDVLKIDCEGGEWRIIPRLKDVSERVGTIFVEYHCINSSCSPSRFVELLKSTFPEKEIKRHKRCHGFGVISMVTVQVYPKL